MSAKIAHPIAFTYANFAKVLAGTKTEGERL